MYKSVQNVDTIGNRYDTSRYGGTNFSRITQDVLRAAIDGGHQEILKQIVKDGAPMFTPSFVLHDAGLMFLLQYLSQEVYIIHNRRKLRWFEGF